MSERREPRDASNPVNPETAFINFTTWPPVSSMSSSSSSSSSNSSSSSDIDSPETVRGLIHLYGSSSPYVFSTYVDLFIIL